MSWLLPKQSIPVLQFQLFNFLATNKIKWRLFER